MRDLKVTIDLEAEDTLAVRLKSLHVKGERPEGPARPALEGQARAILGTSSFFEGGLALLEVDGVSNAVLIRTPKPSDRRFVQIVLRNGDSIELETHGSAVHLSRENYEKFLGVLSGLFEEAKGNLKLDEV